MPSVATTDALAAAGSPGPDGWREVTLPVESLPIAHGQLLGLGAEFEVLAPASLRAALADTAVAMARRHGQDDLIGRDGEPAASSPGPARPHRR